MLANPERSWERAVTSLDRAEVERRLGPVSEPLEVLSGGLANLNVRVGRDKVIRVYQRDPRAMRKEAALLRRGWRSLRVPRVLSEGDDFLLLEHVAHVPLEGTARHGAALGNALAEIHSLVFATAGFLDDTLKVAEPFPDLVGALADYMAGLFAKPDAPLPRALRERVLRAIEARATELRELARSHVLLHADFKVSNLHWAASDELLVLDWEFAYAGAALSDVGQLLRWKPPREFVEAFAAGYRAAGGTLPEDWELWAAVFDLFNLAGLVARSEAGSRRAEDVTRRVEETLALLR
jgi:hypothetical protein